MFKDKNTNKLNWNKIIIFSLIVIFVIPILVCSIILSIQGLGNKRVPSIGNIIPLIVTTKSMEKKIYAGDLIFVVEVDAKEVEEEDIISFWDPDNKNIIVTHRVERKYLEEGKLYFITKGDNNDSEDDSPVPEENVIGIYKTKIPFIGKVSLFLQTNMGLFVCLFLPLTIILGYDYYKTRKYEEEKDKEIELLKEEIRKLKEKNN